MSEVHAYVRVGQIYEKNTVPIHIDEFRLHLMMNTASILWWIPPLSSDEYRLHFLKNTASNGWKGEGGGEDYFAVSFFVRKNCAQFLQEQVNFLNLGL